MQRPGGITALAVFNFILGAMLSMGALQYVFFAVAGDQMVEQLENQEGQEESVRQIQALVDMGPGKLIVLSVLASVVTALLIMSGVGYLKLRRFLGFWLGLAGGVVSAAFAMVEASFTNDVDIETLSNLVYPIVTVGLLTTVFRKDFGANGGDVAKVAVPPDHQPEVVSQGRWAHIGLIAGTAIRFALRTGGGVIFLVLILLVGLSASQFLITQAETVANRVRMQGTKGEKVEAVLAETEDLIEDLTEAGQDQVQYLMQDQPALVSAVFLIFLIIVPFSSCVAGFNQTAGDIGTKGLRYLLLRTERANIYFGRFLGTVVFSFIGMACLLATVTLYIQFKLDIYDPVKLWTWAFQGWFALCVLALPHMAICAWISGASNGPFISFAIGIMAIGFPLALLAGIKGIVEKGTTGDWDWILQILPWGWKYDLLSGDLGTRIVATLFMLGFTALMLYLGYRSFRKRDL